MQAIIGIVYHFIGGFASRSFYVLLNKVGGWNWESYLLLSWLGIKPFSAYLTDRSMGKSNVAASEYYNSFAVATKDRFCRFVKPTMGKYFSMGNFYLVIRNIPLRKCMSKEQWPENKLLGIL